MPFRKLFGLAVVAGALSVLGNAAFTQANYPAAPIRVIIPLAPGGAIDVMVRALGRAFEKEHWSRITAGINRVLAANGGNWRQAWAIVALQGGAAGRLHDLPAVPQLGVDQSCALQKPVLRSDQGS